MSTGAYRWFLNDHILLSQASNQLGISVPDLLVTFANDLVTYLWSST